MNEKQGRGQQGHEFEDIRILGLDSPDDDVEPGRSVFAGDSPGDDLPHWTEPPTGDVTGGGPVVDDPWAGLEGTPRWSDDVPEDHESQQPVGDHVEAAAVFFDDGPLGSKGAASHGPTPAEPTKRLLVGPPNRCRLLRPAQVVVRVRAVAAGTFRSPSSAGWASGPWRWWRSRSAPAPRWP